eukprot:GHVU01109845.1.p2 GENE.GHVU01109845.1~~GHVU01109845.1.p2  ORF type:complete len:130 (+),score=21.25 GHVU01109845.1:317-706(+)
MMVWELVFACVCVFLVVLVGTVSLGAANRCAPAWDFPSGMIDAWPRAYLDCGVSEVGVGSWVDECVDHVCAGVCLGAAAAAAAVCACCSGLDNAGKTTVVKKFNGEDISRIPPTLGFSIKTLEYKGWVC